MKEFDDVWADICNALKDKKYIETLSRPVRNDIVAINPDSIEFKSKKTNNLRKVPKSQFKDVWDILVNKGSYTREEHAPFRHGAIISAVYARLPYIGWSKIPREIWLKIRN